MVALRIYSSAVLVKAATSWATLGTGLALSLENGAMAFVGFGAR